MREFMNTLLLISLSMSIVAFVAYLSMPILTKRYSAKGCYYMWLVVVMGFLIPYRPELNITHKIPVMTELTQSTPVRQVTWEAMIDHAPLAVQATGGNSWNISEFIIFGIWLLGVLVFLSYHGIKHFRFVKMVKRFSEDITNNEAFTLFQEIKIELGITKEIKFQSCPAIGSPMMINWRMPCILLPEIPLKDEELYFIIKHELIHWKRKDIWYKSAVLLTTALHWFNPMVFFMAKIIRLQCEMSCDEEVTKDMEEASREKYSETILSIATNQSRWRTQLSTDFLGGKKNMKKRITAIMDSKKKKMGIVIISVFLLVTILTGSLMAMDSEKYRENQPNTTGENSSGNDGKTEVLYTYAYRVDNSGANGVDTNDASYIYQSDLESTGFYAADESIEEVKSVYTSLEKSNTKGPIIQTDIYETEAKSKNQTMTHADEIDFFTTKGKAKEYSIYAPFGLTYDKKKDCFYYDGKLVRTLFDLMETNGEELNSGNFSGTVRQIINDDGEIDVYTIRDFTQLDKDGFGTLVGIAEGIF